MVEVLYVVTWRYADGSGSGSVAAFTTEAAAEKLVGILTQQGSMRNYKVEPVPFDGPGRITGVTAFQPLSPAHVANPRGPEFTRINQHDAIVHPAGAKDSGNG